MIETIDHVNLVVRDLEAMTAFYRDTLELKITKQVTIRGPWIDQVVQLPGSEAEVVYLDCPTGPRVELIRYRRPSGTEAVDPSRPNTTGIRHIAFRVRLIDELAARLKAKNIRLFGDVQQVPDNQVTYAGGVRKRLIYFLDPEGNILELCEYR